MKRAQNSDSKSHAKKSKIGLLEQIWAKNPYVTFFLGHPVYIVVTQRVSRDTDAAKRTAIESLEIYIELLEINIYWNLRNMNWNLRNMYWNLRNIYCWGTKGVTGGRRCWADSHWNLRIISRRGIFAKRNLV